LLDPDLEFSPSDLDPDTDPALIIGHYQVIVYKNPLTILLKTVKKKNLNSGYVQVYEWVYVWDLDPVLNMDGQVRLVRLVRLQTDNFYLFLSKQTTNFCLHDEPTVNGLRKIAWASVFRLKQQHI
jgi:hypothetical protein